MKFFVSLLEQKTEFKWEGQFRGSFVTLELLEDRERAIFNGERVGPDVVRPPDFYESDMRLTMPRARIEVDLLNETDQLGETATMRWTGGFRTSIIGAGFPRDIPAGTILFTAIQTDDEPTSWDPSDALESVLTMTGSELENLAAAGLEFDGETRPFLEAYELAEIRAKAFAEYFTALAADLAETRASKIIAGRQQE